MMRLHYNKKITFVGNLINRVGNRILKTRGEGVNMHEAIITVLTPVPSDVKNNMDQFHRLWAQGLHGHKTLSEDELSGQFSGLHDVWDA